MTVLGMILTGAEIQTSKLLGTKCVLVGGSLALPFCKISSICTKTVTLEYSPEFQLAQQKCIMQWGYQAYLQKGRKTGLCGVYSFL